MFRLWKKHLPAATITPPTPPPAAQPPKPSSPLPSPYIHGGVKSTSPQPGEIVSLQVKSVWFFIRAHWQLFAIIGILIAIAAVRLPQDIVWLVSQLRTRPATPSPTPTITLPPSSLPTVIPSPLFSPFEIFPSLAPDATPTIAFREVPVQAFSGQPFIVKWTVDGPRGSQAQITELKATSGQQTQNRFFTDFSVPREFSATFTYAGPPGSITLEATATLNGQNLITTLTIPLN